MAEVIPDTDSVEVAKIGFAHWVAARGLRPATKRAAQPKRAGGSTELGIGC